MRKWRRLCSIGALLIIFLMFVSQSTTIGQDVPHVEQPTSVFQFPDKCWRQVDYHIGPLAPNSEIIVTVQRNTTDCQNGSIQNSQSSYDLGKTDSNGYFVWTVVMTDVGHTTYTFSDHAGGYAFASFDFNGQFSNWNTSGGRPDGGVGNPPTQQPVGPRFPNAQTADGGIHTVIYCQDLGWDTAQHSDSGADIAYSHRCVTNQQVMYFTAAVFEQACQDVWGSNYHATLSNADDLGGWKCISQDNPYIDSGNGQPPVSVPTFSQFQIGANGLDVQGYCRARYNADAINDGNNAYSWNCQGQQIDKNAVCMDIWGSQRPYAWVQGGLGGWSCEPMPQPGQPVPQVNNPQPQGDVPYVGSTSVPSGTWVKIITGMLNIRDSAGVSGNVIAKAPFGNYLSYLGTDPATGWFHVSWGSGSGWVSGGSAYTQLGSGADNGGTPPVVTVPNPSCPLAPRLSVGAQGRSTDYGAQLRLRSSASTGGSILTNVPNGGVFSVLAGPSCSGGYNWWQVNYNGITGWVAEGSDGTYFVEPYGSAQVVSQPQNTISEVYVINWDQLYVFRVDRASCYILNGDEIVAQEISRFSSWLSQKQGIDFYTSAASYLTTEVGQIDDFRRDIEASIQETTGCTSSRYVVDGLVMSHTMDMSGLGNIAFGFFEARYPEALGEIVANSTQGVNPRSLGQFSDNPDDRTQRATGRAIQNAVGSSSSVSLDTVHAAADSGNLR